MKKLFRTKAEYYSDIKKENIEIEFNDEFSFTEYEKRYYFYLDEQLEDFEDSLEIEFIARELHDFNELLIRIDEIDEIGGFIDPERIVFQWLSSKYLKDFFVFNSRRTIDLLINEKTRHSVSKIIRFLNFKNLECIENESGELFAQFDLVDFSELGITEKIIFLSRLGVLDFLKGIEPFNTSTNRLASVISAFTGEKTTSIQPMINPMFSKQVDDSKNPMNSKKTVQKVDQKLISIGFKIKNTN